MIGLRKGRTLRVEGHDIQLLGSQAAGIFNRRDTHEVAAGASLNFLLGPRQQNLDDICAR